jgi:hypothetical protein
MSKVTRIVSSRNLHARKYEELIQQAKLLGKIRTEVWDRFGSISGVGSDHRKIRDAWMQNRDFRPLAAKAWKETLRDTLDDVHLYEESAKTKVRKAIHKRTTDEQERKRLYTLLKGNNWCKDKYLCRMMRKHKKHGRTKVCNQIIVEDGVYKQFQGKDKNTWLKIPSLVRGKMICIPLNSNVHLNGALRVILKCGVAYVHRTTNQRKFKPCGDQTIGVDKGYTEALADSKGGFHGTGFGKIMTAGTQKRLLRGQARNKLHELAKKTKNKRKAHHIHKFNLGRKKLENYNHQQREQLRTKAFEAAHRVVDIAKEVRAEDLSKPMNSSGRWKSYNRMMSAWARGFLSEALDSVTKARGSRLRLVNAAYTSQMDSKSRRLEGRREGDKFYHANGEVSQADTNAAINIEHRADDTEISIYTSYKEVKAILLNRLIATGGVSPHKDDRPSRTPVTRRKRTLTESERTKILTTESCQGFL